MATLALGQCNPEDAVDVLGVRALLVHPRRQVDDPTDGSALSRSLGERSLSRGFVGFPLRRRDLYPHAILLHLYVDVLFADPRDVCADDEFVPEFSDVDGNRRLRCGPAGR